MYSVVIMAALAGAVETPDFGHRGHSCGGGCYGGGWSCGGGYGGCWGSGWSCGGGYSGCYGSGYAGGCWGSGWSCGGGYSGCWGSGSSCHGGYYAGSSCHGGSSSCYGSSYAGGCWGSGSSCHGGYAVGSGYGGCSGSSYAGGCWGSGHGGAVVGGCWGSGHGGVVVGGCYGGAVLGGCYGGGTVVGGCTGGVPVDGVPVDGTPATGGTVPGQDSNVQGTEQTPEEKTWLDEMSKAYEDMDDAPARDRLEKEWPKMSHEKRKQEYDAFRKSMKKDDKDKDGKEVAAPAPATLIVSLPADARLTIEGQATTSTSARRVFVSPALPAGKDFHYTLQAEVVRAGKPVSLSKVVPVRAGVTTSITLEVPASTPVASR